MTIETVEEGQALIKSVLDKLHECTVLCVEGGIPRYGAMFMMLAAAFCDSTDAIESLTNTMHEWSKERYPEVYNENITMQ